MYTSTVYDEDDIDVVGLVPDGVSHVQLGLAGSTKELPVELNTFATHVTTAPDTLDYAVGSRDVHEDLSGSG